MNPTKWTRKYHLTHQDIPTSWDCTRCKENGSRHNPQRVHHRGDTPISESSQELVEVSDIMIFTKLLDGACIFQCICGHIHRGHYGEYCNSCGRIYSQENTTSCSSEEYRASRAD